MPDSLEVCQPISMNEISDRENLPLEWNRDLLSESSRGCRSDSVSIGSSTNLDRGLEFYGNTKT